MRSATLALLLGAFVARVVAFPSYASPAGLSERELEEVSGGWDPTLPGKPPGPMKFTGTKLVNDWLHPYLPPGPLDIRGPCPGLNALANHGVRYLAGDCLVLASDLCDSTSLEQASQSPRRLSTRAWKVRQDYLIRRVLLKDLSYRFQYGGLDCSFHHLRRVRR